MLISLLGTLQRLINTENVVCLSWCCTSTTASFQWQHFTEFCLVFFLCFQTAVWNQRLQQFIVTWTCPHNVLLACGILIYAERAYFSSPPLTSPPSLQRGCNVNGISGRTSVTPSSLSLQGKIDWDKDPSPWVFVFCWLVVLSYFSLFVFHNLLSWSTHLWF